MKTKRQIPPFPLYLYGNDTAAAIAKHVGTASWRFPVYHYDDYDNWEVMQYYDIPSRYEIPSNDEAVVRKRRAMFIIPSQTA